VTGGSYERKRRLTNVTEAAERCLSDVKKPFTGTDRAERTVSPNAGSRPSQFGAELRDRPGRRRSSAIFSTTARPGRSALEYGVDPDNTSPDDPSSRRMFARRRNVAKGRETPGPSWSRADDWKRRSLRLEIPESPGAGPVRHLRAQLPFGIGSPIFGTKAARGSSANRSARSWRGRAR
jgi:hypothetical protein